MNDYVMEGEHDVALEAEAGDDAEMLGDGAKTKGTNWIDPDSQP